MHGTVPSIESPSALLIGGGHVCIASASTSSVASSPSCAAVIARTSGTPGFATSAFLVSAARHPSCFIRLHRELIIVGATSPGSRKAPSHGFPSRGVCRVSGRSISVLTIRSLRRILRSQVLEPTALSFVCLLLMTP